MEKFGRRSFLRLMGQFTAILCMGLYQKKALAQKTERTTTEKRPRRISVEEHIVDRGGLDSPTMGTPQGERIDMSMQDMSMMRDDGGGKMVDIGDIANIEMRLKDMDENGIDMQVLSWSGGGEDLVPPNGIIVARKHNDKLGELINRYPERFAGFAMIPWQDPSAAVFELERAVKDLGLKGIKINGPVKGEYLDAKKYWPVLKKAEELGTPIFIHIGEDGIDFIRKEYSTQPRGSIKAYKALMSELDVSIHAMRLISSGVFDELPKLKFILGHMGEGLPFWSWRFSRGGRKEEGLKKKVGEYIKENFYSATSGNFYHAALICCCLSAGADHVLFGVDFPTEYHKEAIEFMETAPISDSDKEKIYHLNAERIFGI